MTAFTTRMPAGVVGAISRFGNDTQVEPSLLNNAAIPAYGQVVKLVTGKAGALASADAGTVAYGWAVRPFPHQSSVNALGAAVPDANSILDVMRRGYMSVSLKNGAPAKGDQVYVVTTVGGSYAIGDVVASASPAGGGTAVAIPGATFMGPADANGITEIHQKY
jgi:hypothetical protein